MIKFSPKALYMANTGEQIRHFSNHFCLGKVRTKRERQVRAGHCKACKLCEFLACLISGVSSGGGFMFECLLSGFLGMSEGCVNWQGGSLTLTMEELAQQRSLHQPVYRGLGELVFSPQLLGTSQ